MTKIETFRYIKTLVGDDKVAIDFIDAQIAQLSKKRVTKRQLENEPIKQAILDALEAPMTITELNAKLNAGYSNEKISALTHQLVKDGMVKREVDKGKAYFSIA